MIIVELLGLHDNEVTQYRWLCLRSALMCFVLPTQNVLCDRM